MSGRARFSTGCHACRRMKVKCDEGKPECARCIRADRKCPGYREHSDMVFRSMNASVAARTRTSPPEKSPKPRSTNAEHMEDTVAPRLIQARLSIDWDRQAIAHFLYNYTSFSARDAQGYLEFLPELLAGTSRSQCLHDAVLATSMANMGNISNISQLQVRSRFAYGRALQTLALALADPNEVKSDCTLTAIVLLQMYEILNGLLKERVDPHEEGLSELLHMRGEEQFQNPIGRSLFRIIVSKKQIRALDGKPLQQRRNILNAKLINPIPLRGSLWRILQDVSQSTGRIQLIMAQKTQRLDIDREQLFDELGHAQSIQNEISSWQHSVPSGWRYEIVDMSSISVSAPESTAFPSRLYLFKDLHSGAMWITLWISRMSLLENILRGVSLLSEAETEELNLCRENLRADLLATIDDICASGPNMLGEIDDRGALQVDTMGRGLGAFYYLRGLHIANMVDDIPLNRRIWILEYLAKIGHSRGIKMALRSRERRSTKQVGLFDSSVES